MQWFKSHVGLRHNPIYRRMSADARSAFDNAMRTAADYEQNGALSTRIGPLTDEELAHDLIVSVKKLPQILGELVSAGFLRRDENSIYWVEKFVEKTESSADRQKRYRVAHPDLALKNRLKEYGLTEDEFREMFTRQGDRCPYCGVQVNESNSAIDHIIPLIAGGRTRKDNLQILCRPCNGGKAGKTGDDLTEYIERRKQHGVSNGYNDGSHNGVTNAGKGDAGTSTGAVTPIEEERREKKIVPKGTSANAEHNVLNLDTRRKEPKPEHLLLSRLVPIFFEHHDIGFSQKDWRKRAANPTRSLLEAGHTDDEIEAMAVFALTDPRAEFFQFIDSMEKLAKNWSALSKLKNGRNDDYYQDPVAGFPRA